jgi:glycosyltransferase involved in cell wall biosynthesis
MPMTGDGVGAGLRVLYSFPHPLGAPGINTTAWHQVDALVRAGARVTVVCTSLARPLPAECAVIETMRVRGRRVPHRAVGIWNALAYHDLRVARILGASAGQFDVVHCWPSSCLRTIAAARRTGVTSYRELPNAHTADTFAASARACAETGVALPRGYSHRYDRRRLRREEREFATADFLLAPSDFVAHSFTGQGIAAQRILRHRYGYDQTRFNPSGGDEQPVEFTALFVGRGEPPKGLHLALRAWQESGVSGRFLIAGTLIEPYRAMLTALLARPDVSELGFVSDVPALMRGASVLVLPSYTEGSALVSYEAMGSGLVPLVSTAVGAPVRDGVDGLLHDVGDVAVLAAQLRRLADDPGELDRLRRGALESSRSLRWLDTAEPLCAAYRRAVPG